MNILGLCGSLRENSSNALLLLAARNELKNHSWLNFDLSRLPFFDPDLQYSEKTPKVVLEIRARAAEADVLFVCTPEYAHGVPGLLKNAFEWIFFEGTQRKPVYVVIGSAEGENTKDQLLEILSTMDFEISDKHFLLIKGARAAIQSDGSFRDESLKSLFSNFCELIHLSS